SKSNVPILRFPPESLPGALANHGWLDFDGLNKPRNLHLCVAIHWHIYRALQAIPKFRSADFATAPFHLEDSSSALLQSQAGLKSDSTARRHPRTRHASFWKSDTTAVARYTQNRVSPVQASADRRMSA